MSLRIELDHCGHTWTASGSPVDLSVPVNPHSGLPRAWYKGPATAEPVRTDSWTGSVAEGGSVNFRDVTFNPHAHGTHTETREHIRDAFHPIDALARSGALPFLMPALLVEAMPESRSTAHGDDCRPSERLGDRCADVQRWAPSAVLLRCTTGDVHRDWSTRTARIWRPVLPSGSSTLSIEHLLIDLPSVDREIDGGVLRAHTPFLGTTRPPAPTRPFQSSCASRRTPLQALGSSPCRCPLLSTMQPRPDRSGSRPPSTPCPDPIRQTGPEMPSLNGAQ